MSQRDTSTEDARDAPTVTAATTPSAAPAPAPAPTEGDGALPADAPSSTDGPQPSSDARRSARDLRSDPIPGQDLASATPQSPPTTPPDRGGPTVSRRRRRNRHPASRHQTPPPPQDAPEALGALWRQTVLRHCEAIESDLAAATTADLTRAQKAIAAVVEADITQARAIATSRRVSFDRWWSGGTVESAWVHVREAEERIIEIVDRTELHARAVCALVEAKRHGVGATNPAVVHLGAMQDLVTKPAPTYADADTAAAYRAAIRAVVHLSNDRSDRANQDARATRNRMIITWVLAAVAAVSLVVLQWRIDSPLLPTPDGWDRVSDWVVMLIVMAFGVVGALLTAIPVLSGTPTDRSPFNLPLQQTFVKLSAGTLSAVAGVLVVSTADAAGLNIDIDVVDAPALLVMAMVFGASQQALTRYFDRRADEVLAPPKPAEPAD